MNINKAKNHMKHAGRKIGNKGWDPEQYARYCNKTGEFLTEEGVAIDLDDSYGFDGNEYYLWYSDSQIKTDYERLRRLAHRAKEVLGAHHADLTAIEQSSFDMLQDFFNDVDY